MYPNVSSPEFLKLAAVTNTQPYLDDQLPVSVTDDRAASRKPLRIVELVCAALVAFLLVVTISFLLLRPTLKEIRTEARSEWAGFIRSVAERNSLIPGLIESYKGFESGHSRFVERLMQARSISIRSTDPDRIVASVDEINGLLEEIGKLAQSKPGLAQYPPFAMQWKKVEKINHRMSRQRAQYNAIAGSYNRFLNVFPQNLLAVAFGFVPLNVYPVSGNVSDSF